jgi:hypothetical protein
LDTSLTLRPITRSFGLALNGNIWRIAEDGLKCIA